MFRKSLFRITMPPACEYCAFSRCTPDRSQFFCTKRGAVHPSDKCPKFVYNPLHRVPRRQPKLPTFSLEDFEL